MTEQDCCSCRDGLPNPPRKAGSTIPSELPSTSRKPSTLKSDGNLKHLEALHKNSGGLDLPHGRHLTLEPGRPAGVTKLKKSNVNMEAASKSLTNQETTHDEDSLPDPHEILTQPISKTHNTHETGDSASDSDMVSDLSTMHGSLKTNLGNLQSPNVSRIPLRSRRRSRTTAINGSLSPSPPPAKRQRLSTCQLNSTVTKSAVTLPAVAELTTSRGSRIVETDTAELTAQQARRPLFLEGPFGSDVSPETGKALYEDDEPFTLDLDAFDIEPSTMTLSVTPTEQTTDGYIDTPDTSNAKLQSSTSTDKDITLEPDGVQIRDEAGPPAELDGYSQAIAEFNAWLYSGAVELID